MKESDGEGLAICTGPESCGVSRKGGVEALTGVRMGWVLSRERFFSLRDADALHKCGRQHRVHRHRKVHQDPARSETPGHVRKHFAREPGDPVSSQGRSRCETQAGSLRT